MTVVLAAAVLTVLTVTPIALYGIARLGLRIGRWSWPIAAVLRREGGCYRCKTSWLFVRSHVTPYEAGKGIRPLCEGCWSELSVEGRWTFYSRFLVDWYDVLVRTGRTDEAARLRSSAVSIQAALRAGS